MIDENVFQWQHFGAADEQKLHINNGQGEWCWWEISTKYKQIICICHLY
jgi:hypothetical protein